MKRRVFLGAALAGLPITGAFTAQPKARTWDIPTTALGRTASRWGSSRKGAPGWTSIRTSGRRRSTSTRSTTWA